ncbi:hypothetical protein ACVRZR_01840 [Streptococcus entericus]|uniref:hypothetical protein n=1 Tax=Streptococcus entericus TaxID=155680 RepID=UPI00037065AD|nr:hypothetical protein [Streptococcus entericus]
MNKKYFLITCTIITFIVIPFLINLIFKFRSIELLVAEWNAGDLLSFYGSILGSLVTLWGLNKTLDFQFEQSQQSDIIKYKPILKLESVLAQYNDFIARREIAIKFPFISYLDDPLQEQKQIQFSKQMEKESNFHFLVKNKGRGEAVNVILEDILLKEVSWDEHSHLYIAVSQKQSLDEILVNDVVDIVIRFPEYIFLKEKQDNYTIRIEFSIKYKDMFRKSSRQLTLLSEFKVFPKSVAVPPYIYKESFDYFNVEFSYEGTQIIVNN